MDLSDPLHVGIWDPDELPMTGGTEAHFGDFLTGELLQNYPRLLGSSIVTDCVRDRAEPPDFLPFLLRPIGEILVAIGAGGKGVMEAPAGAHCEAHHDRREVLVP